MQSEYIPNMWLADNFTALISRSTIHEIKLTFTVVPDRPPLPGR